MDSTWCVVTVDGHVHHQVGPCDKAAIQRGLGGYEPVPVPLLDVVADRLRVWQSAVPRSEGTESNFPMRAILAGLLLGGATISGPVVVAGGSEDQGIPADILDRLEKADQRARTHQPVALTLEADADTEVIDDTVPARQIRVRKALADEPVINDADIRAHMYDPPRCDLCRIFARQRQQSGMFPLPEGGVVVVHANGVTSWDGDNVVAVPPYPTHN